MEILLFNTAWMLWNLALAYFSIYLGRLTYRTKKTSEKIIIGFLWLLFVPNTIYILTDFYHITYQRNYVFGAEKAILYLQYILFVPFGILTYLYSLSYFDKSLKKLNGTRVPILLAVNILIGVGVIMGRVLRFNSWDLFLTPVQTLRGLLDTIRLPHLLIPSIIFGILFNIIYFTYRKAFVKTK